MNFQCFFISSLVLTAIIIFLFVTAPPPLPNNTENQGATVSIDQVFALLEAENDVAREIWTKHIVKAGKQAGLKFSEDWKQADIEAGPLPALFLRETAKNMERNPLRLSLFLGSEFPISRSNQFEGIQKTSFELLKTTTKPQFFLQKESGLYVAMFPDYAISEACVDCHNDHKDTPKSDWQLNDIMGATTWMYTKQRVTFDECLALLDMLRKSIRTAYSRYLEKVNTFQNPPIVGDKWPEQGYFLPDIDSFMARVRTGASVVTLNVLLEHASNEGKTT